MRTKAKEQITLLILWDESVIKPNTMCPVETQHIQRTRHCGRCSVYSGEKMAALSSSNLHSITILKQERSRKKCLKKLFSCKWPRRASWSHHRVRCNNARRTLTTEPPHRTLPSTAMGVPPTSWTCYLKLQTVPLWHFLQFLPNSCYISEESLDLLGSITRFIYICHLMLFPFHRGRLSGLKSNYLGYTIRPRVRIWTHFLQLQACVFPYVTLPSWQLLWETSFLCPLLWGSQVRDWCYSCRGCGSKAGQLAVLVRGGSRLWKIIWKP